MAKTGKQSRVLRMTGKQEAGTPVLAHTVGQAGSKLTDQQSRMPAPPSVLGKAPTPDSEASILETSTITDLFLRAGVVLMLVRNG